MATPETWGSAVRSVASRTMPTMVALPAGSAGQPSKQRIAFERDLLTGLEAERRCRLLVHHDLGARRHVGIAPGDQCGPAEAAGQAAPRTYEREPCLARLERCRRDHHHVGALDARDPGIGPERLHQLGRGLAPGVDEHVRQVVRLEVALEGCARQTRPGNKSQHRAQREGDEHGEQRERRPPAGDVRPGPHPRRPHRSSSTRHSRGALVPLTTQPPESAHGRHSTTRCAHGRRAVAYRARWW